MFVARVASKFKNVIKLSLVDEYYIQSKIVILAICILTFNNVL